jgi:hypothetical protein
VSEGALERALQVMAQLVAVLKRQGYTVEVSEQGRTAALIGGERIFFGIEEPVRKVVTQKPRVPNPTDRWDYDKIVTHEPGGKLALVIHSGTWGKYEQRTRWSDVKVQRIENLIAEFVAGLMRTAIARARPDVVSQTKDLEISRRNVTLKDTLWDKAMASRKPQAPQSPVLTDITRA